MAEVDSITPPEYRIVPGGDKRIYRVGSDGSAWSSKDDGKTWFRMTPGKLKSGHRLIYLGRKNCKYLHRLVMEAFAGPPPKPGMFVCHINDDPSDNRLENLRYGTRQDNADDAVRNGRIRKGGSSPGAKLTEEQAREIGAMIKDGVAQPEIARQYEITIANVQAIAYGITWSHATGIPRKRIGKPTRKRDKLSEADVREIFRRCRDGIRQADIAAEFDVTMATVSGINRGFSWNQVTGMPRIRAS